MPRILLVIGLGILAGCSTVSIDDAVSTGKPPLCKIGSPFLGKVAVVLKTNWRTNQKEPEARANMARKAIKAAFSNFSCGSLSTPGGLFLFPVMTSGQEPALRKQFGEKGVSTLVIITLKELGPLLKISLPALWTGETEIKFDMRVVKTQTGEELLNLIHHRLDGGPFVIRNAQQSSKVFEGALKELIGNEVNTSNRWN